MNKTILFFLALVLAAPQQLAAEEAVIITL